MSAAPRCLAGAQNLQFTHHTRIETTPSQASRRHFMTCALQRCRMPCSCAVAVVSHRCRRFWLITQIRTFNFEISRLSGVHWIWLRHPHSSVHPTDMPSVKIVSAGVSTSTCVQPWHAQPKRRSGATNPADTSVSHLKRANSTREPPTRALHAGIVSSLSRRALQARSRRNQAPC